MGKRTAVYNRTGAEFARLLIFGGLGAGLGAGAFAFLYRLITTTASTRIAGVSLSSLSWGNVGAIALGVGLVTVGCLGVFARPRVVLTRETGGTGSNSGYGSLWAGPDGDGDLDASDLAMEKGVISD